MGGNWSSWTLNQSPAWRSVRLAPPSGALGRPLWCVILSWQVPQLIVAATVAGGDPRGTGLHRCPGPEPEVAAIDRDSRAIILTSDVGQAGPLRAGADGSVNRQRRRQRAAKGQVQAMRPRDKFFQGAATWAA